MNIAANGKVLIAGTKALLVQWRETKESWRDEKSREFEEKYLGDLLASVERSAPVFEDLDKLITKARNECE